MLTSYRIWADVNLGRAVLPWHVVLEALCFRNYVMVLFLLQVTPKLLSAVPPGKATLEVALLETLLDLVDRYWSGCKSLHSNEVFLGELGRDSHSSVQSHV